MTRGSSIGGLLQLSPHVFCAAKGMFAITPELVSHFSVDRQARFVQILGSACELFSNLQG